MENKKNIIGIGVLVLCVLVFCGILGWNALKDDSKTVKTDYESKQLSAFNRDFSKQKDYTKSQNMSAPEASYYLNGWLNQNKDNYNSNSVNQAAFDLQNVLSQPFNDLTGLLDGLTSKTESFDVTSLISGLLGGEDKKATRTIAMKSNTVCQSVADSKYCVNKLSANVYITDANSPKWVVLVHPFMTSGSLIYNSLGEMYHKQGYNVLAPDLRGFGNSDGSVAMGYLESLDIYDWIKDLNANWKDANRYGVNVQPTTLIVHGISLGGATTLQLATNPDIAKANGKEPYTKNLTQLNVKGFIDDCGYTSMSGIITGMLGAGNTIDLSSILSSLNIKEFDFMSGLQDIFKQYGITGFENIDLNSLKGGFNQGSITDKLNTYNQFTNQFAFLDDIIGSKQNIGGQNNTSIPNKPANPSQTNPYLNGTLDLGNLDLGKLKEQYGGSYNIPTTDNYKDYLSNLKDNWTKYSGQNNMFFQSNTVSSDGVTPIANNMFGATNNTGNVLDSLIGTVLMDLVGVGLTEDNYNKYSDVFSTGRKFPSGSKVGIIHGTGDTTVPFSNADTVAKNVSPATLLKKWEVSGAPHAFVIIGSKTSEYESYIANFTDCIENTSCKSFK